MTQEKIPRLKQVSSKPSPLTEKEKKDYENAANPETPADLLLRVGITKEQADILRSVIEAKGADTDIELRKRYAGRAFWMCASFLFVVLLMLAAHGLSYCGFQLSETVILALIGATTVNVLGIFYCVMYYLFPKKKEP